MIRLIICNLFHLWDHHYIAHYTRHHEFWECAWCGRRWTKKINCWQEAKL